MSDILYSIASIGFFFSAVRCTVILVEAFQKHNYSVKKFLTFLTATASGRSALLSPLSLAKWLIIFSFPAIIFFEVYEYPYHIFVTLIYILELIATIRFFQQRNYKRLKSLRQKAWFIIILTLCITGTFYVFPPLDRFLWITVIDRGIIFFTALLVVVIAIPEEFYWEYRLQKDVEKNDSEQTLATILLLGDGEGRIQKLLLSEALSQRFSVHVSPDEADFRAVIKAYEEAGKRGCGVFITMFKTENTEQLQELIQLISPSYVIISERKPSDSRAISGIIKSMPQFYRQRKKRDVALIFEIDALHPQRAKRKSSRTVSSKSNLSVDGIKLYINKTVFHVSYKGARYLFETSLVTEKAAFLFAPVIGVLAEFGFSLSETKQMLLRMPLPENFLSLRTQTGIHLMLHSAETDLQQLSRMQTFLKQFTHKTILVLDGDIVAGSLTHVESIRIGRELAKEFHFIFIIDSPAVRIFRSGLQVGKKRSVVTLARGGSIASYIESLVTKDDFILFYGPRAESVYYEVNNTVQHAIPKREKPSQ